MIRGRRRDVGLGGFPLVSLKEARDKAFANRKAARQGGDPVADRQRPDTVPTFAAAAERVWTDKHPGWRRVRQRISAVMDWAVAMEYRSDNPCDRLGPVLGPQHDLVEHMRALPHGEVAAAIRTMGASGATPVVKLAFEFLVLTAARSGEVRGARWAEIDLRAGVWMIPAGRMKSKREHRVPLCGRAVKMLRAARTLGDGRGCFKISRWPPCRTASGHRSGIGPRNRRIIRARWSRRRSRMWWPTRPRRPTPARICSSADGG